MKHRGGNITRTSPGWWQPLLILLATVSCGLLIGMTGGAPPTCEDGGACGPEIYFQQTIYWEDENSVCGDGYCNLNEGVWNCPADCSECGDMVCRPDEVDTCPEDCPVEVTCGDGVCSYYENSEACPIDCQDVTSVPPTSPPTSPSPSSNGNGDSDATSRPTKTPSPTPTETKTPTETEEVEPTEEVVEEPTATQEPEPEDEVDNICEEVDKGDLPGDLADTFKEYYRSGTSSLFTTCQSVPKEICVALDPDVEISDAILNVPGRVLLRQDNPAAISIDDLELIDLTYCATGSDCISYAPTSLDKTTSLICFSVADQELVPVCINGCTFGLYKRSNQTEANSTPVPPDEDQRSPTLTILLVILVLAIVTLVVLVIANRANRT